jgi:hypothetical protein
MSGSDLIGSPASDDHAVREPNATERLIGRLNERGFRLVQVADIGALAVILVGAMVIRRGWWPWPTYSMPMYALSFTVVLGVFFASLYFGGLYEREPRLGRPPLLPRVARQTVVAGAIVALLNLVVTGAVTAAGLLETERAFPVPTLNLITLMVLGAVAITANRRISTWMRANREGPTRVVLVGAPDDLNIAQTHLAGESDRVRVAATASDVAHLADRVDATEATEVMLLSGGWLDSLYPNVMEDLEARGVNVLQRVTAKETMYGLERIRQIGGMPFVLLRAHAMPVSRAHFKRFTDLIFLLLLARSWCH